MTQANFNGRFAAENDNYDYQFVYNIKIGKTVINQYQVVEWKLD